MTEAFLNNEDDVHRQAMFMLKQARENEASAKRARQGSTLTYRPDGPHSFFLDAAKRALHGPVDPEIEGRMRDHNWDVRRHRGFAEVRALNESAGDGSTFVPPDYIQSEFQAAAHPLRTTANLFRQFPIDPKTGQVNVPVFTSGSGVSVASSQNTTLDESDPVDAVLTCNVSSISGKVVVSRQLLDWSSPDSRIDHVLASDLGAAVGAQVDSSVLSASGSGSTTTGLINTAGCLTAAAGPGSSVDGLVIGVASGYQQMTQVRFRKPDVCVMHPRRWLEFANAVDLQGRPLLLPSTKPSAMVGTPDDGCVGEWMGMRVYTDVNVPTTSGNGSQDFVILGHSPDWLLYQSPLNFQVDKEQLASSMSVNVIGWFYMAAVVRYASSVCLVGPFNAQVTPGS